ncbi:MAG: serine/threonine-protein kinase [Pirellulales bacterium]
MNVASRNSDHPGETLDGPIVEEISASHDRPKVEIVAGARPRLATETRSQLRGRLRLAAGLLLAATLFVTLRGLVMGSSRMAFPGDQISAALVAYRYLVMVVLALATIALWSKWNLSLQELRGLELAIFGLICVFFLFLHLSSLRESALPVRDSPGADAAVDVDRVRRSTMVVELMWFALVVIYGTFIPNSPRRAAVTMGAMSLAPLAVLAAAGWLHPSIRSIIFPNELTVAMAVSGVGFATAWYGSYKITMLRREAFEARQLGQYRLTERLGSGGMGEVYLAEHQMLKRPCAVKLIRPGQATDTKSLARFEREVRAISRLTHWNSVEIFDYGRADDGTFYYAMEYLPGLSLQQVVERQGPMQPERAVHLLRQVCQALSEAHSMGIIHRDIKPSNIIASQRGGVYDVAKLLDFGLATSTEEMVDVRLTQDGTIAGSPLYLAPERFLEGGEPDARSDIYALGGVLYFVLTGRPPFRGDSPLKLMIAHAREPVVRPRELDASLSIDLEAVIMRCLEKSPADRFADAMELERALAACGCANAWTQQMAIRWWAARPESQPLETATDVTATTMS